MLNPFNPPNCQLAKDDMHKDAATICWSAAKGPHNLGTRCQSESHFLCFSQPETSDTFLTKHCTWNLENILESMKNQLNWWHVTDIPSDIPSANICKNYGFLWVWTATDVPLEPWNTECQPCPAGVQLCNISWFRPGHIEDGQIYILIYIYIYIYSIIIYTHIYI